MYAMARSTNMKSCSLFVNTPFTRLISFKNPVHTFFAVWARVCGPSVATVSPLESVSSIMANISSVSSGGGARLNFAILCRTSMASASLPLLSKNLGDSWNVKTKKRRKKMNSVTQPRIMTSYRHPMLLDTVQQGSPSPTALQDGRSTSQRYLAAVP